MGKYLSAGTLNDRYPAWARKAKEAFSNLRETIQIIIGLLSVWPIREYSIAQESSLGENSCRLPMPNLKQINIQQTLYATTNGRGIEKLF